MRGKSVRSWKRETGKREEEEDRGGPREREEGTREREEGDRERSSRR
jgi:hypothetical protein